MRHLNVLENPLIPTVPNPQVGIAGFLCQIVNAKKAIHTLADAKQLDRMDGPHEAGHDDGEQTKRPELSPRPFPFSKCHGPLYVGHPGQQTLELATLDGPGKPGHDKCYCIAFLRFSSTLSRKPSVVSHF
jgi:hypothetical protein